MYACLRDLDSSLIIIAIYCNVCRLIEFQVPAFGANAENKCLSPGSGFMVANYCNICHRISNTGMGSWNKKAHVLPLNCCTVITPQFLISQLPSNFGWFCCPRLLANCSKLCRRLQRKKSKQMRCNLGCQQTSKGVQQNHQPTDPETNPFFGWNIQDLWFSSRFIQYFFQSFGYFFDQTCRKPILFLDETFKIYDVHPDSSSIFSNLSDIF